MIASDLQFSDSELDTEGRDGQTHSKHFNNESISDIDIMIPYGEIDDEDELVYIDVTPDFVYIKRNSGKLAPLPNAYPPDQQYLCIDGSKLKQKFVNSPSSELSKALFKSFYTVKMDTTPESTSAKADYTNLSVNFII
ncbi:unnamed protein product [Didymodactylos carnosus]|uniref:Uncharacterized protein n=1 Tax=Didymodactylos carnosus TaxID=1234261 RepID=A0A8S2K281_9BILA|nr:unnamed protein product [Didymodactylos carnosus]CAF3831401.1 unnamed protein product [Didymodactylos carnosus]